MHNKISKHSSISLAIIASAIIVVLGSAMNVAYAQTLTIETDKDSYASGDEITISGQLTAPTINQPILIRVFDPDGNFVRSEILDAAADGSYSYTFTSGGPLMAKSGTYRVQATYAGTVNQETTFEFEAAEGGGWRTIQAEIGGQNHPIEYMITGSGNRLVSITGNTETATLVATLSTASDGTLSLRFNEEIFDADDFFVTFADGIPTNYELPAGPGATNELHIDFEWGTEEVEIVGDRIIPEFGAAITAIVLAVAIVGIIVATARYGKFNFVRKEDW